jgi:DNA primase catalytic core, N-terminal domain
LEINLDSIQVLPKEHWCLDYVKHRKIPERYWHEIFYTGKFQEFYSLLMPNEDTKKIPNDERLIFPIWDENHNVQGIVGRSLKNAKLRYVTKKIFEESIKLYGLHRVNKAEKVYVTEGPIDSLFIKNCVATCDSDLLRTAKYVPKENLTLIFDNEYSNESVRQIIHKAQVNGFNVCIFPKYIKEKDINEMIMAGKSEEEIQQIIDENTFSDLRISVELLGR